MQLVPNLTHTERAKWASSKLNKDISRKTICNLINLSSYKKDLVFNNIKYNKRRLGNNYLMEEQLYNWILKYEDKLILSQNIIKSKAAQLSSLYPSNHQFNNSNGWIEGFKHRYLIKSYQQYGESGSANIDLLNQQLPEIQQILNKYPLSDIYNCDESSLYYRQQVYY